jgi:hypothetical protein
MIALSMFQGEESRAKLGLIFMLHQVIAIWVTLRSAPILLAAGLNFLRLFGRPSSRAEYYWILNGNPYFPVQIGLGLILGWLLGRYLRHRSMIWVWVLPCAVLCYALVAIPTLNPTAVPPSMQAGVGQSRIAHYFGWGCQAANYCFDQEVITSPFYATAAYSLAAVAAEELTVNAAPATIPQVSLVMAVGVVFFLGAIYDLVGSIRLVGWRWMFIPVSAVPAAMGGYLLLLAFSIRIGRTGQPSALDKGKSTLGV